MASSCVSPTYLQGSGGSVLGEDQAACAYPRDSSSWDHLLECCLQVNASQYGLFFSLSLSFSGSLSTCVCAFTVCSSFLFVSFCPKLSLAFSLFPPSLTHFLSVGFTLCVSSSPPPSTAHLSPFPASPSTSPTPTPLLLLLYRSLTVHPSAKKRSLWGPVSRPSTTRWTSCPSAGRSPASWLECSICSGFVSAYQRASVISVGSD